MVRSRAIVLAASALLLGTAGVFACTAGEDIQYDTSGLSTDGGIPEGAILDDAGRIIFESGVPVKERPEASTLPPPNPQPCVGLVTQDGGACDTTAGFGCCLDPGQPDASCEEQVQYSAGAFCATSNAFFVACTSSIDDSLCCLQPNANGSFNTRYRASCDGGVETCDPSQDGGFCTTGSCTAVTCTKANITIGFCGATPPGFTCP